MLFSASVSEAIGFYVYLLKDPRNSEIFYVGKGIGNRVFNHVASAGDTELDSIKHARIREIEASGFKVEHVILRHGLSEQSAFEVEAAAIDLIGFSNLSNLQSGHASGDFGIRTAEELEAIYAAELLDTELPILLININRLFHREMGPQDVYETTRKAWKIGIRRNQARYAVATYGGLTREVYQIAAWFAIGDRWGFNGTVADPITRNCLRFRSIKGMFKKGAANPIKYLNC